VVVVQHALDEHEVERVVRPGQAVAVADDEVQPGIGPASGGHADGGGGRVEADHPPGRPLVEEALGGEAVSASDVEDAAPVKGDRLPDEVEMPLEGDPAAGALVGRVDVAATLRLYSVYGPYEEPSRFLPSLIVRGLRGELPPLADASVAR